MTCTNKRFLAALTVYLTLLGTTLWFATGYVYNEVLVSNASATLQASPTYQDDVEERAALAKCSGFKGKPLVVRMIMPNPDQSNPLIDSIIVTIKIVDRVSPNNCKVT